MALILLAAYLIGSIPFALLMARRWHVADLRLVGSGNLGAANVMRASGVTAGVLVAVLDMAKGAASVWLGQRRGGSHCLSTSIEPGEAARSHGTAHGGAGMKTICVLGAGSWGTALSVHLGRLDHDVCLWARDQALVDDIQAGRVNEIYLPG